MTRTRLQSLWDSFRPDSSGLGRIGWWLAWLCLTLSLLHLVFQVRQAAEVTPANNFRDVDVFYVAAQLAWKRESPYQFTGKLATSKPPAELTLAEAPRAYLYPPPFAVMLSPLTVLPAQFFYAVMAITMEVCLWVFVSQVVWLANRKMSDMVSTLLLIGPLAFSGLLLLTYANVQVDPFIFAGCTTGAVFAWKRRPHAAAVSLAVVACIKLYPLLLLLPLWRRHGGKPLVTAAVTIVVINAVSLAWLGWESYRDFLHYALPLSTHGTVYWVNTSLSSFLGRGFVVLGWAEAGEPIPMWLRSVYMTVSGCILLSILVISLRLPLKLSYGWVAFLSPLIGAVTWVPYWTLALVPAAVMWRLKCRRAQSSLSFPLVMSGVLMISSVMLWWWPRAPVCAPLIAGLILAAAYYLPTRLGRE